MDGDQIDGKLPGDVIVSILSNLPAKSLLKFKAVCKSWRSFISSPSFIKIHLHSQSIVANNFLMCETGSELTFVSDNYNTKAFDFDDLFSEYFCHHRVKGKPNYHLVGSCKGLVCVEVFYLREEDYYCCPIVYILLLWNPATGRYRSIEIPENAGFNCIGLGYVESTNDYKIVGDGWAKITREKQLIVYALSSDSWKVVVDYDAKSLPFPYPPLSLPPTLMNGCMHWLLRTGRCVDCTCGRSVSKMFAFDVEDEVMSCFGVPYSPDSGYTLLDQPLVIRGCLSIAMISRYPHEDVMEGGIFEIWVMVEYGVEGSWVKQFTIQAGLTAAMKTPLISWKDSEILFGNMEDEKDLLKLMFYDPCSKKINFLENGFSCKDYSYPFQVLNYVETLASVMGGRNLGHRTEEDCTALNSSTTTTFGPWMLGAPRRRRRRAPPKPTHVLTETGTRDDNTTVPRSYSRPVSPTRDGNNSGSRFNILADLQDQSI